MSNARLVGLWAPVLALVALAAPARGDLIYESAVTLRTGPFSSAVGQTAGPTVYTGVNFFVPATVQVERIGGHFHASTGSPGTIFGAIFSASSEFDPPTPFDLSSGTLGTTLLTLPPLLTSDNISAPLSLTLSPGWYGLLFGSGRFGATGEGAATLTLDGLPANLGLVSTYSVRQSDGVQIIQAPGARFFVEGTVVAVPEPSAAILLLSGIVVCAAAGRWLGPRRRKG